MTRDRDTGVILVNVLVTLALGAALVVLMLTSQDNLIDRAQRSAAMAQARAIALGAETSVLLALRRDMQDGPDADHFAEPWAQVRQADVLLATGTFSVQIRDAQAGLDLNGLIGGGIVQRQALDRLVAALDLPAETAQRIVTQLAREGPATSLDQMTDLAAETRLALAPYVSFLPAGGDVNLNTAEAVVIGAVLRNQNAARRLIAIRDRAGFVTADDLRNLGVVALGGVGFRSDVFDVTTTVQVVDVILILTSRLQRSRGVGTRDVRPISRQFSSAVPTATP